jgi:hypothetical protein
LEANLGYRQVSLAGKFRLEANLGYRQVSLAGKFRLEANFLRLLIIYM